mmetsp:Transcript_90623/g.242734  ORF Transcript_90623/g.242734 Transcript_90623/m.242734 type:complete len:254 (-) Transcript_90623:249-1010(-)
MACTCVTRKGDDSFRIVVNVRPSCQVILIRQVRDDSVEVDLTVPRENGQANAQLLQFMAVVLQVKEWQVTLDGESFLDLQDSTGKMTVKGIYNTLAGATGVQYETKFEQIQILEKVQVHTRGAPWINPANRDSGAVAGAVCSTCGKKGHMSDACPTVAKLKGDPAIAQRRTEIDQFQQLQKTLGSQDKSEHALSAIVERQEQKKAKDKKMPVFLSVKRKGAEAPDQPPPSKARPTVASAGLQSIMGGYGSDSD